MAKHELTTNDANPAAEDWEAEVAQTFADDIIERLPESQERALRVLDLVRSRVMRRGYGSTPPCLWDLASPLAH